MWEKPFQSRGPLPIRSGWVRLLLVEDEPGVARFVRQGLLEAGYTVDVVTEGKEGLAHALSDAYDAVILDIMLPGLSGIEIVKRIRNRGMKTPVILLTARDTVSDRVAGLDAGADDYLIKPFAFPELLARIRALLRRPPVQTNTILTFDELELDTARHEVRRAGRSIELSPREFALLEVFMRHPHQALTRAQIIEHVWSFDLYSETNVIDVYVGYLRRKIDRGFNRTLIQTVRGVGYRMEVNEA